MEHRTCTFTPADGETCGALVEDPLLFCMGCLQELHQYSPLYLRQQRAVATQAAAVINGVATPYIYRAPKVVSE